MNIPDEALVAYLKKHASRKRYSLEDGAVYLFKLKPSPNPTQGMPYTIVLYSSRPAAWKEDQEVPACFALECLNKYNGGARTPDRFIAKTGARTGSRRGRYFLELLLDLEKELSQSGGQLPAGYQDQSGGQHT